MLSRWISAYCATTVNTGDTMNYRNDIIMDAEARGAYLANVRKNAAKHGLYLTIIIGEAAGMNEIFSAIDTQFCKNQR